MFFNNFEKMVSYIKNIIILLYEFNINCNNCK